MQALTRFVETALEPYKDLKRDLGRVTLQADLILLAWRHFVTEAGLDDRGLKHFIEDRAKALKIDHLEHINELPGSEERLCNYFIVMIFEMFEGFLANCSETADKIKVTIPFKGDEGLYQKLGAIRALPTPQNLPDLDWSVRHRIIDYYRIVRDRTVHAHLTTRLTPELTTYHNQWREHIEATRPAGIYQYVPPTPGVCQREDVRFCAFAILEYAFLVSQVLFDPEKLRDYVQQVAKQYRRFITKRSRFLNAVVSKISGDLRIDRRLSESLVSSTMKL